MTAKGTHIRVSAETLARMRAEILLLLDAVESNRRKDPGVSSEQINPRALGFSFDQLINLLLDARERDRRRDRRHRAKKRGEGNAKQQEQ